MQKATVSVLLFVALTPVNISCGKACSKEKSSPDIRHSQTQPSEQPNLVFAQVIFRHGDRNPSASYPTDTWKDEKHWPEDYGQLTQLGMQQAYELGEYLRRRYKALIPIDVYPNKLVYVQSTDRERTLMSAGTILAGLFPPSENQLWNKNILWQPIPIHTIPVHMDHVLAAKKPCDRYKFLVNKHFNRPEYKAWRSENRLLYQEIQEKSGLSTDNPLNVIFLHDTLRIQQMKNKKIPDWAVKMYDNITKLAMFEEYNFIGTREMSRFSSGFLLREIIERFYKKIDIKNPLKPNRNLWLYSAHDTTITGFMNLLDLLESTLPPIAASLLLELYQQNGKYFVQIVYKKNNDEHIPPLCIPGCGTFCPLDEFYDIYKQFMPSADFETECKLHE